MLSALQCQPDDHPSLPTLHHVAFCPQAPLPELFCSFGCPLRYSSQIHTCFFSSQEPAALGWLLLGLPDRLKEPERPTEAGWGCLSSSAYAGQMSQLARINGSLSFLVLAGSRDRVFLEVWPGFPSHTMYLLSEVIINNECLGHDDHPW